MVWDPTPNNYLKSHPKAHTGFFAIAMIKGTSSEPTFTLIARISIRSLRLPDKHQTEGEMNRRGCLQTLLDYGKYREVLDIKDEVFGP